MSKVNNNSDLTNAQADTIIAEGNEKFAYILDKDPTPKQEFYAAAVTALTGIEVSAKVYQAVISTHRFIQASDLNRARADYRPRTAESVIKASETLLNNAESLRVDDEGALISKSSIHIPEDIFAPGQLAKLAAEAEAQAKGEELDEDEIQPEELAEIREELAEEVEIEEVEAEAFNFSKYTKAELIEEIVQAEVEKLEGQISDDELSDWADQREHQLKRENKASLLARVEKLFSATV